MGLYIAIRLKMGGRKKKWQKSEKKGRGQSKKFKKWHKTGFLDARTGANTLQLQYPVTNSEWWNWLNRKGSEHRESIEKH